jgi:hypothetical protein
MNLQTTKSNEISKPRISELMAKVKDDLSFGVKIFGSEINHNDVIRVWTVSRDNVFGLIATSSSRFNSNVNFIEIQSFRLKPYLKLSLINKSTDSEEKEIESRFVMLNDNFFELNDPVDNNLSEKFIQQYISSKPNVELTKSNFEKYFYNKSQFEWLKPELYID